MARRRRQDRLQAAKHGQQGRRSSRELKRLTHPLSQAELRSPMQRSVRSVVPEPVHLGRLAREVQAEFRQSVEVQLCQLPQAELLQTVS